MAMGRLLGLGCLACTLACAQTFPADYRTDDATVVSRLRALLDSRAGFGHSEGGLETLVSVPANRVYRQLDAQARVAALQTALPLVKQIVMSDAVLGAHDQKVALQLGAVNHGLRLPPPGPDPKARLEEMQRQINANPSVMGNEKFMQEFLDLQLRAGSAGLEEFMDGLLPFFTKPLAEVKTDVQGHRQTLVHVSSGVNKCLDDAAALETANPERFRLQAFRCVANGYMEAYGKAMSEAEADKVRKERAQRLYDRHCGKAVVRSTLEQFVRTAKTVDFDAQTTAKGGMLVFVDPKYEKRSNLWRLLYRNGKEPTLAAVAFAEEWLKELQPPATASAVAKPAPAAKAAPAKAAAKK